MLGKSTVKARISELMMPLRGNIWILSLCILIAVGSAFEVFGQSRDFISYSDFFDDLRWSSEVAAETSRFEFGFVRLSHFLAIVISSNYLIYGLLVFLALWIKSYTLAYRSLTLGGVAWVPLLLVVAYYFARFLPLHEFTQIRAALAVSLLYGVFVFVERRRYPEAMFAALTALSFHVSVAFVLPFIIVRPFGRLLPITLVLVFFLFLALFGGWFLDSLELDVRTIQLYQEAGHGGRINPFSILVLLDLCLIIFGFIFWDRTTSVMKKILVLQLVGMSAFYGLLDYAVVAFRAYEIYATMWVFYLYDALTHEKFHAIAVGIYISLSLVLYPIFYFIYEPFFS